MTLQTLNNINGSSLQDPFAKKSYDPTAKSSRTLQDEILGIDKKDDPTETKDDDKKKSSADQVQLSQDAQSILNGYAVAQDNAGNYLDKNSLEVKALEFRGLQQTQQRRDLSPKEQQKFDSIKQSFADIGVNEAGIKKIAEKRLQDIQTTAPDLVQLFNDQQITGGQFKQLSTINKLLNNSNGFGSEEVEGSLQLQANQLSEKFNQIVSGKENQKLSREDISSLEQLQTQLSAIQGYTLNVRDTVGPNGLVV